MFPVSPASFLGRARARDFRWNLFDARLARSRGCTALAVFVLGGQILSCALANVEQRVGVVRVRHGTSSVFRLTMKRSGLTMKRSAPRAGSVAECSAISAVPYWRLANGQVLLVTTERLEGGSPVRSVDYVAEEDTG